MHIRLENTESQKAQEIGNLIRSYNRSKREAAECEPLNLYVEDEHGQLLAGLVKEKLSLCFCEYVSISSASLLSEV